MGHNLCGGESAGPAASLTEVLGVPGEQTVHSTQSRRGDQPGRPPPSMACLFEVLGLNSLNAALFQHGHTCFPEEDRDTEMGRHLSSASSKDLVEPESDSGSLALVRVLNHEAVLPLGVLGGNSLAPNLPRAGTEVCPGGWGLFILRLRQV